MRYFDILWIEDDTEFVDGTLANFKEDSDDLGYCIIPWHYTSKDDFEENSSSELNALVMNLVCVDYHLPGGVNGDDIIKLIRSYPANKEIRIIFYSAIKNERELEALIKTPLGILAENIYFASKDTLEDQIIMLFNVETVRP